MHNMWEEIQHQISIEINLELLTSAGYAMTVSFVGRFNLTNHVQNTYWRETILLVQ